MAFGCLRPVLHAAQPRISRRLRWGFLPQGRDRGGVRCGDSRSWGRDPGLGYLVFLGLLSPGFFKRTPAPPPFSSMNSTPAACNGDHAEFHASRGEAKVRPNFDEGKRSRGYRVPK